MQRRLWPPAIYDGLAEDARGASAAEEKSSSNCCRHGLGWFCPMDHFSSLLISTVPERQGSRSNRHSRVECRSPIRRRWGNATRRTLAAARLAVLRQQCVGALRAGSPCLQARCQVRSGDRTWERFQCTAPRAGIRERVAAERVAQARQSALQTRAAGASARATRAAFVRAQRSSLNALGSHSLRRRPGFRQIGKLQIWG
jgi:hypothetical protein